MQMNICKSLAVTFAATALLAALVSTASARQYQLSNQNFRVQFREILFRLPGGLVNCQVTIEGSLHSRTLAKVVGSLIGYITEAALGPCALGTATILTVTLPWHVRYAGFTGTLPNITQLLTNIIDMSFRVRNPMETCLAVTTAAEPARGIFAREVVTGALTTMELNGTIRTGAECFGAIGSLSSNRDPVTLLGTTSRITVRLI
jgi:hypothetical protein